LGAQLIDADELAARVSVEGSPVLDQGQGGLDEASQSGEAKAHPVEGVTPEDDGAGEQKPVGDRAVVASHPILGGVCDEDDDQEVGDAEAAGLALEHRPQDDEEGQVDRRAADEDLREGDARVEGGVPAV